MKSNFFVYYLIIVNIVTFALFAIDKFIAVKNRTRIRNATLLGMAFIGGSVGALLAMHLFRHKTKRLSYTIGITLMLLIQAAALFWLREQI
ncbi:MAG: DUF1294 domain-containing protein [Clostridiales bacterium]|nr:DUF1294 domain-containing protein [Clostridiales bacterium]